MTVQANLHHTSLVQFSSEFCNRPRCPHRIANPTQQPQIIKVTRPSLTAWDFVINRQIPKWEENPTASTQPFLQFEQRVLMRLCRSRIICRLLPMKIVLSLQFILF